jgi:erythromycin esterase-like protein/predicted phosphoribosyltransferase
MRFRNRVDAGRQLAARLTSYASRNDVIVLGLPRGGVPVAFEVARALGAPLDVFLVRKLGVPGHPELAMGAIAAGGVRVLSEDLISELDIPRSLVELVSTREHVELDRRQRLYRGARPFPNLEGKTVILIDDGLATGATMEAAVAALRELRPARIVVAAPVGAEATRARLRQLADEVVCVQAPEPFYAVGQWYERFDQTSDDEVVAFLAAARQAPAAEEERARPIRSQPAVPDPIETIRSRAQRLDPAAPDYDALIRAVGDDRVILIGEASHGTHDFYRERAFITERLIAEQRIDAVAVEADWPDAYRVNRYVRGLSDDRNAIEALGDFERFPAWMWRNTDVAEFVAWLRAHNDTRPPESRVGFYGLDLYSLRSSMQAVVAYLSRIDPEAAARARRRYACFDRFGEEPQSYGYAAETGLAENCEQEAISELIELQRRRVELARRDGRVGGRDDLFFIEQNARIVRNAEQYYRIMFRGRHESWNLRDRHMVQTLTELMRFLGDGSRVVVWAHNSHLGDARATEMGEAGELNVGQLVREEFGARAVLIGQTTHTGTVTAAPDWNEPSERKNVRPSLPGSYERLLHDAGLGRFLLPLRTDLELAAALGARRLERAIGVVYVPQSERRSHYFHARLSQQFDYVLHFDETTAVEPLERTAGWEAGEVAETFPTGL